MRELSRSAGGLDAMIAKIKVIHVKLANVAFVKKAQAGDQEGWEMAWDKKTGTYTVGVFSGERNDGEEFRAWAARQ